MAIDIWTTAASGSRRCSACNSNIKVRTFGITARSPETHTTATEMVFHDGCLRKLIERLTKKMA